MAGRDDPPLLSPVARGTTARSLLAVTIANDLERRG